MQPIKVKIMKIKSLMGPLKSGEVSPVPPPPPPFLSVGLLSCICVTKK